MVDKFQQLIEKGKKVGAPVQAAMQNMGGKGAAASPALSEELTRLLVNGEITAGSGVASSSDTKPWESFLLGLQVLLECGYENKEQSLINLQRRLIPLLTQVIQSEKAFVFLAKKSGWIDLPNYFKHELFALKKDPTLISPRKMLRSLYDHFQTKGRLTRLFQKTEHVCYEKRSQFTDTVFVGVLNDLLGNLAMFNERYLKKDMIFFKTVDESAKTLLMKQPVQKIAAPVVEARDEDSALELRRLFPALLIKLHHIKEQRQEQAAILNP